MATVKDVMGKNLQGQVGKQLVLKQYGDKTVVSAYPDMSNIVPSDLQLSKRSKFKEAVACGVSSPPAMFFCSQNSRIALKFCDAS